MAHANKKYFDTDTEARTVATERRTTYFKILNGRHKGRYYVGSYFQWINL